MADARVISGEPIDAVEQELRDTPYDGVVVSTLHAEHSAWMRMGLPQKIAATFEGEVRHVEAAPEFAGP